MDYRSIHKRRAQHTRKKLVFIIGIPVAVVILLFLYLFFFTSVFDAGQQIVASPIPAQAQVAASSEGIYYLKGTTLYHTDKSGSEIWNSKFSTGALNLRVSDTLICVFDDTSASVVDVDKTPLFTVPPSEFTIKDAVCGNSTVVFLTEIAGENVVSYLRVFDKEGTELYRTEVTDDKILKFGLSGANDSLWTLTLDTTGVSAISRVTTMSPTQKTLTGNIDISDQLISNVFFTQSDMYLSGTSNLSRYNSFAEKQNDVLVYGLSCVDFASSDGDAYFAYIPSAVGETVYNIRIIKQTANSQTAEETLLQLPKGVVSFSCTPKKIFCFTNEKVYVYKTTGEFIEQIDFDFKIDSVKKLSDELCLLSSGTSTYIFSTK